MMIKEWNKLIRTYAYRMNKDLVRKKKEIKCTNITKQYKNVQLWLYYKGKHQIT